MNDRLIEILEQRNDFTLSSEDKRKLDFFAEYLDHGSLFLVGYEPGDDPLFVFTNDAQRYRFRLSEIRTYVNGMKSGTPMPWEEIPFEYIQS